MCAITAFVSVFGSSSFAQLRLGQTAPAPRPAERLAGTQKSATVTAQPRLN